MHLVHISVFVFPGLRLHVCVWVCAHELTHNPSAPHWNPYPIKISAVAKKPRGGGKKKRKHLYDIDRADCKSNCMANEKRNHFWLINLKIGESAAPPPGRWQARRSEGAERGGCKRRRRGWGSRGTLRFCLHLLWSPRWTSPRAERSPDDNHANEFCDYLCFKGLLMCLSHWILIPYSNPNLNPKHFYIFLWKKKDAHKPPYWVLHLVSPEYLVK